MNFQDTLKSTSSAKQRLMCRMLQETIFNVKRSNKSLISKGSKSRILKATGRPPEGTCRNFDIGCFSASSQQYRLSRDMEEADLWTKKNLVRGCSNSYLRILSLHVSTPHREISILWLQMRFCHMLRQARNMPPPFTGHIMHLCPIASSQNPAYFALSLLR